MMSMDEYDVTPYLPHNPATQAKHRREVLQQITLPFVAVLILLFVVAFLAAWGLDAPEASRWGDISLVFLIIPAMFMTLIGILILGGLVYLHIKLIAKLPPLFYRLHNLLLQLKFQVEHTTDKLVQPVIKAKTMKASADALRGWSRGWRVRR